MYIKGNYCRVSAVDVHHAYNARDSAEGGGLRRCVRNYFKSLGHLVFKGAIPDLYKQTENVNWAAVALWHGVGICSQDKTIKAHAP